MTESKVKDKNFITIIGFMRTELNLSGNELLCYALLYGYCQNGEKYTGSAGYIADWLGVSKVTAFSVLKKLQEKGLVEKFEKIENNVKFCNYKTLYPVKKFNGGSKESLSGGSKESLPHNNIKHNIEDNNLKKIIKEKEKVKKEKITFEQVVDFETLFRYWEENKNGPKYKNEDSRQRMLGRLKELTDNNFEFAKEAILFCIDSGYQGFCSGKELYYRQNKKATKFGCNDEGVPY